MVNKMTGFMFSVEHGQAIALPHHHNLTVCAVKNSLWLTQEGRAHDIVISGDECVTLQGRGLVVAQALTEKAPFQVRYPTLWISNVLSVALRLTGKTSTTVRAFLVVAACITTSLAAMAPVAIGEQTEIDEHGARNFDKKPHPRRQETTDSSNLQWRDVAFSTARGTPLTWR